MTALDKDRMDERISVQATWNTTTHNVAIKVSNIGIIDVELIRLWILDKDHEYGLNYHDNAHLCIDISDHLSVGGHTFIDEIDELITLFNDIDENPDFPFNVAETTYYFKVVTARGNIANTLLVPYSAVGSQWPAVIIPSTSYVKHKLHGPGADIHLEVYNSLDETIIIKMLVATRYGGDDLGGGGGAEQSEIITVDPLWILISGDISVRDFVGESNNVYTADIVLIELINVVGLVVSSYYFPVQ